MKEYLGVCGFFAVCSGLLLLLSKREKELSALLSAILYVLITVYLVGGLSELLSAASEAIPYIRLPYSDILLRAAGVTVVSAVCTAVCEAGGQAALARSVEMISVLEILYLGLPVISEVLSSITEFLGG